MSNILTEPLTPAELELAGTTGGIHINALLLNRIKTWANTPENKTTIRKPTIRTAVEKVLWEAFGGLPKELETSSD